MIKKNLTSSIILVMMLLITPCVSAQTYRQIKGWSKEVNDRLEDFLNSTITMKIRKVAVFDGDGTVMGQVPHYLARHSIINCNFSHRYRCLHVRKIKKTPHLIQRRWSAVPLC